MEETAQGRSGEDHGLERGSILIVTRNGLALTKKAVASALAQDIPCDLLVVDNASTDGTPQWLATKDITTICLSKQESLSACWNRGLKAFWSIGKKHCLVCNNDVELRGDAYRLLLAHEQFDFVTCVSVDKREQMGVAGDRDHLGEIYGEFPKAFRALSPRPHPDMSCFLIHRSVTDKIGWFDENYWPAFCEDLDIHIRMHNAGIDAMCIDVPFLHHGSATVKNADLAERSVITRGADRNRQYFFQKWGVRVGSAEYYALFQHEPRAAPSRGKDRDGAYTATLDS